MKQKLLVVLVAVVIPVTVVCLIWFNLPESRVPAGKPTPPPAGAEWIDLLDEEHAEHWRNTTDDKDIFEIVDKQIHIFGKSLVPLRYVGYTGERFDNFDLHLEYRLTGNTNSGVFLRAQPNDPVYRGFEIQVLDDHGKPPNKNRSGAIYDVTTPMYNMSRLAGYWNSFDITVDGPEVLVAMNGWLVVHTDLSMMTMPIGKYKAPFAELPMAGNLLLQDHGGEVWYRNIVIRKHDE